MLNKPKALKVTIKILGYSFKGKHWLVSKTKVEGSNPLF
jgi:hypothetical protein